MSACPSPLDLFFRSACFDGSKFLHWLDGRNMEMWLVVNVSSTIRSVYSCLFSYVTRIFLPPGLVSYLSLLIQDVIFLICVSTESEIKDVTYIILKHPFDSLNEFFSTFTIPQIIPNGKVVPNEISNIIIPTASLAQLRMVDFEPQLKYRITLLKNYLLILYNIHRYI